MPSRARRPCNRPGCPNLSEPGTSYCSEHKKDTNRDYDKTRGSSNERGYGYRWQKYRVRFLKAHPLCECDECKQEERVVPATDVDHVIAVSGLDDPLFWEPSNHRAMAHGHHSRKTVREDGGFKGKKT